MKLFLNSYNNVNPQYLSFVADIENFEKYPCSINVYEEILRESDFCRGSLIAINEVRREYVGHEEEGKPKSFLAYMAGRAMTLQIYASECIPSFVTDLVSGQSRMLKMRTLKKDFK